MSDLRGDVVVGTPLGGPASAQFLATLQALVQALNGENAALTNLLNAIVPNTLTGLHLTPIAPPAAPTSGSIIYVSNVDNHTYVVGSSGTRTSIAVP